MWRKFATCVRIVIRCVAVLWLGWLPLSEFSGPLPGQLLDAFAGFPHRYSPPLGSVRCSEKVRRKLP